MVLMYASAMVGMGLLIAWPAPACNNPIFAEIVPPEMRSMIYGALGCRFLCNDEVCRKMWKTHLTPNFKTPSSLIEIW